VDDSTRTEAGTGLSSPLLVVLALEKQKIQTLFVYALRWLLGFWPGLKGFL
jgi:hypothetical protein